MSTLWAAVLLTSFGCYLLKLAGLCVPPSILNHRFTQRATDLIPPALLGALIGVQVLGGDQSIVLDARLPALGLAAVLLWARVPFLPAVVAAAACAALLRL